MQVKALGVPSNQFFEKTARRLLISPVVDLVGCEDEVAFGADGFADRAGEMPQVKRRVGGEAELVVRAIGLQLGELVIDTPLAGFAAFEAFAHEIDAVLFVVNNEIRG